MWIRLTSFASRPDKVDDMRKTFRENVTPAIKSQPGLIDAMLLEPADDGGEFISLTMWRDRASAEGYDSSGTYKQLVGQVTQFIEGQPVLRSYEVKEAAASGVNG